MGVGAAAHAQLVTNGTFESPTNTNGGTDPTATGWTMSPAPNMNGGVLNYTNTGQRCTFASPTPTGGTWSFWEQTFTTDGTATQTVGGVTPGLTYTLGDEQAFEVNNSSISNTGFNAITAANQSAGTPNNGENGGNGYSYLGMVWLNNHGNPIGTLNPDGTSVETIIAAGSVTTANHVYAPYAVSGIAPVGASSVEVVLGWANGGQDGNTGGQSAFATDVALNVPEPGSLSLLAVGAVALIRRRSRKIA
jgi:hypothetical protein